MRDPLDIPDVVRLSVPLKLCVPAGFRERVAAVAATEGIGFAEFTRRAIVERVRRIEGAATTSHQIGSAGTSPPHLNTLAAQAGGNPMSGASASTAASTKRRDA